MSSLVLKNALITGYSEPVHILVNDGMINKIINAASEVPTTDRVYDAMKQFVCSGFYESHIHLDKACILDRCTIEEGTLEEAVSETGKAKKDFTVEDVFNRASQVVEMAIKKGTQGLRTFVETDPKTLHRSFDAIKKVRDRYAYAIEIEICAFAQEGLTQSPETLTLLKGALENGADLLGGCPYKDEDPEKHIEMIFDLAESYDVDVDFHLDFDLDPENSSIPKIAEETCSRNYQGRVSIGHVTKLSAMTSTQREEMMQHLKKANITLTVLPATDLFLKGRDYDSLIPRGMVNANPFFEKGIATTISSNNILNAFTPYGDASLLRMANMYANVAQLSKDEELQQVYAMITEKAAELLSQRTEIKPGAPANFVILEARSAVEAIRCIAQPLAGFKNGLQTFANEPAKLLPNPKS